MRTVSFTFNLLALENIHFMKTEKINISLTLSGGAFFSSNLWERCLKPGKKEDGVFPDRCNIYTVQSQIVIELNCLFIHCIVTQQHLVQYNTDANSLDEEKSNLNEEES